MNNDELFEAVREVNTLIIRAQKSANEANATLKQSLPLLEELLEAVRLQSTQRSLDEFGKGLSLDDLHKMLVED